MRWRPEPLVASGFNRSGVPKGADAPDLRFQSVAFQFKANTFYEGKTGFSCEIVAVANGE